MANYLYKAILYKNSSEVIDVDANNDTNLADFQNNHKAAALKIEDVALAETTFIISESYASFSARIVSPLDWSDIKYKENHKIELYLLI